MSKIEKIKVEIERLKNELIQEAEKGYKSEFDEGRISSFEDMITFIDSLEEEPISNDLKEAAIEAFKQIVDSDKNSFLEIFKAGAEWGMRQAEVKIQAQSTALTHRCPKEFANNDLEEAAHSYVDTTIEWFNSEGNPCCYPAFIAGAQWQKEQIVLNDNNKKYHRVPSTTLKRLYMSETKYELLKSDIIEGIVGDFEKGTIHNYLTIKIPMLLCPSNCAKGDKVKLIIVKEE